MQCIKPMEIMFSDPQMWPNASAGNSSVRLQVAAGVTISYTISTLRTLQEVYHFLQRANHLCAQGPRSGSLLEKAHTCTCHMEMIPWHLQKCGYCVKYLVLYHHNLKHFASFYPNQPEAVYEIGKYTLLISFEVYTHMQSIRCWKILIHFTFKWVMSCKKFYEHFTGT